MSSVALVRDLLASQHPDLASLPVRPAARGWDNELFRLGDHLAVRLPHREAAVPLLLAERRWLPRLAPGLPLPVPAPLRRGDPGCGYPWPWSVVPWLPGRSALHAPPADVTVAAHTLGEFFAALHRPAPDDAPVNPWRGVPLRDRLDLLQRALRDPAVRAAAGEHANPDAIAGIAASCAREPEWAGDGVLIHGDPHAHNILVRSGRISAIVDFGDLTGGDPATDLGQLHSLLPPSALPAFAAAYGTPLLDPLWRRAAGWAICLGVAVLGGPDPALRPLGHRLLDRGLTQARALG